MRVRANGWLSYKGSYYRVGDVFSIDPDHREELGARVTVVQEGEEQIKRRGRPPKSSLLEEE